ncbi:MAG: hypothetical protein APR54_02635 [Candidatus Cloacimonas sp. SDB]|nr:MAG: hypothetical protein APR54_02635 [Candidatus Cloacimonas sp. SDB]
MRIRRKTKIIIKAGKIYEYRPKSNFFFSYAFFIVILAKNLRSESNVRLMIERYSEKLDIEITLSILLTGR